MVRLQHVSVLVLLSILAGCGGIRGPGPLPGPVTAQGRVHQASGPNGDLVYAVREGGTAVIATYPALKTVTTFNVPYAGELPTTGMCSDTSGNVFIASNSLNPYRGSIYEYGHGATSPFATLTIAKNYEAFDCASDASTGNLAVPDFCE